MTPGRSVMAVLLVCSPSRREVAGPPARPSAGQTPVLAEDSGTISAQARSAGDDALWMGHAWVDGRHGQADLDALVARLRRTGIRDLGSAATRTAVTRSVRQVLADGFDGAHLDMEPVGTGDPGYLALLAQVHATTRAEGRLLSAAAEPVAGLGLAQPWLPYPHWWSPGYLHQFTATSRDWASYLADWMGT